MLPRDLAEAVVAPPGYLLVERAEMPEKRGEIWFPGNWRLTTRGAEAEVISVGPGAAGGFAPGEHVLLSASTAVRITFGTGSNTRVLWRVPPSFILCRIDPDKMPDEPLANRGEHPMHRFPDIQETDFEPAVDEGDPRGLR